MKSKLYIFFSLAIVGILTLPAIVFAEPCLIVYPTSPAVYHYDVNEYYTVTYNHPLYDPLYDRSGEVLIDINTDEIPLEIYQVPNLTGFKVSSNGKEGYFFTGVDFDLVIDGWNNQKGHSIVKRGL